MKSIYFFREITPMYLCSLRLYSRNVQNVLKRDLKARPILNKTSHCYKTLFPWKNSSEFSEHIISSIIYNKDGLIALNKPFGIKIHGHDKPGTRYKENQRFVIPSIPDCNYTIEDSLPALQKHLNVPKLSILKSAEKYTSGVVLIGSSDKVAKRVTRSFDIAKQQKKPHLVHWGITVGYPTVSYRKEKVGIKFLEREDCKERQPVIVTNVSRRSCKLKLVHGVQVESRPISINKALSTSLIEIAVSSVQWHFVRVYACSLMAPLLGDIMYGSRMKMLLGIPVKVQLQNAFAYGVQALPESMCEVLNLPKGENGAKLVPTMLHLKSVILPNYEERDTDLVISAEPPLQFQWTASKLNLYENCK